MSLSLEKAGITPRSHMFIYYIIISINYFFKYEYGQIACQEQVRVLKLCLQFKFMIIGVELVTLFIHRG